MKLKGVWGEEVEMPYTEAKMDNLECTVDNEGNACMVVRVYRDSTTRLITEEKEINYDLELLQFKTGSGEMNQTEIQLTTGKHLKDIHLFESGDDKIVLAGYYSNEVEKRKFKGRFNGSVNDGANAAINSGVFAGVNGLFKFDLTKGETDFNIAYYEIPLEIINQNTGDKGVKLNKKKANKEELVEFPLLTTAEYYYVDEDGSIVIIGEQYYTQANTSNGSVVSRFYCYLAVLVTKINKDGSLAWMKKLAKAQIGKNSNAGLSFALVEGKEHLHLIYMDNIENIKLDDVKIPVVYKKGKKGFLTAYSIDYASRETKKTTLMDSKTVKGVKFYEFSSSKIISNTDDEFVFEVYKKKKEDVLIKITLD